MQPDTKGGSLTNAFPTLKAGLILCLPVPEKGCAGIGALDPGMTITQQAGGAVINFQCIPGMILNGSSQIYCNGKTWNATRPVCQREFSF